MVLGVPVQFMASRYLFTRGRQIFLIYVSISVLVTLTIFRFFRSFSIHKKYDSMNESVYSSTVPMPNVEINNDFEYGIIRDFESSPFLTEIECEGSSSYDRICKFKNICYSPASDQFFAVTVDTQGLAKKWKIEGDNRLLDLTSVDDHNIFYFEFNENSDFAYEELKEHDMKYIQVSKKTFIFSRFVYNNIMHNIHDDFLGQYIMHKKFSEAGKIDTNNYMFFTDRMLENENDHLLATLTRYPFIYREALKSSKRDSPALCFSDAIVGNSKDGIWYDYGFYDEPQGPVRKKALTGAYMKEAANFIKSYYKIQEIPRFKFEKIIKSMAKNKKHEENEAVYISIFSRTKDRLLLNEKELKTKLEEEYRLPVKVVSLENLRFDDIVAIMSRSVISIGLHGAALIYTAFMPKNSIVIELFPYAIPGENYSPYRTLAWLDGVEMTYRMWKNNDAKASFCQMGQRKNFHGIAAQDFLNAISLKTVPPHVCCGNPYWLIRIYQDTVVNVPEIKLLIDDSLRETLDSINNPKSKRAQISEYLRMSQGIVTEVKGIVTNQENFIGKEAVKMRKVVLSWDNPWKSINLLPSQYGVWVDNYMEELITPEPMITLETCSSGMEINFWIRSYRFDKHSRSNIPAASYSKKFTFRC